jgi:hypothetical protein
MGSDFHYQDANVWFKNMDKLIKYDRENHSQNIIYLNIGHYYKIKVRQRTSGDRQSLQLVLFDTELLYQGAERSRKDLAIQDGRLFPIRKRRSRLLDGLFYVSSGIEIHDPPRKQSHAGILKIFYFVLFFYSTLIEN